MRQAVLVTGAGNGIGRGIAETLAAAGWLVAANDIDADAARQIAADIDGVAVPGDVTRDARDIVAAAIAAGGELAGLVNNAGALRSANLADITADELDATYRLNLRAPILTSAAALPSLRATGGSIVNISSISMVSPQAFGGLYAATKAGLSSFTAQASVEWGPVGVRVNAVAPGMTRTVMTEHIYSVPERRREREELVPLRRIGTPADIGAVVQFLLSPGASYITGQTIIVDGGYVNTLVSSLPVGTVGPTPSRAGQTLSGRSR